MTAEILVIYSLIYSFHVSFIAFLGQMSNANRKPRLDMHHGFLLNIRRNLTVQAEQMSSLPKSVNLKPSSQMDSMSGKENRTLTASMQSMGMHEEGKGFTRYFR